MKTWVSGKDEKEFRPKLCHDEKNAKTFGNIHRNLGSLLEPPGIVTF